MEFHEQFATFHTRAREQLGIRKPIFIEMQVLLCTYNDRCIYILYIIRFRFICHVHKCNEIRCPQLQHITVTIQHVGTVQYNTRVTIKHVSTKQHKGGHKVHSVRSISPCSAVLLHGGRSYLRTWD